MQFKLHFNNLIWIRLLRSTSVESSPLPCNPTEHFTQSMKHLRFSDSPTLNGKIVKNESARNGIITSGLGQKLAVALMSAQKSLQSQ